MTNTSGVLTSSCGARAADCRCLLTHVFQNSVPGWTRDLRVHQERLLTTGDGFSTAVNDHYQLSAQSQREFTPAATVRRPLPVSRNIGSADSTATANSQFKSTPTRYGVSSGPPSSGSGGPARLCVECSRIASRMLPPVYRWAGRHQRHANTSQQLCELLFRRRAHPHLCAECPQLHRESHRWLDVPARPIR